MVDLELDADGLIAALRRRRYHEVPVEVVSRDGAVPPDHLLTLVVDAVAVADGRGQEREPVDPTGTDNPVLLPNDAVVFSVDNGLMTAAEIRQWLADFADAVRDLVAVVTSEASVVIRAQAPARRPPNTDAWLKLPPAPTAFLRYSTPDGTRRPPADLEQLVTALVGWLHLRSEDIVMMTGGSSFYSTPDRVTHDLLSGLDQNPQCEVAEFRRKKPKASRMVRFDHAWLGMLQVYDESKLISDSFDDVIEGMRLCAPFVDYAYCRAATTTMPYETDPPFHLGRPLTPGEELLRLGPLRPLWNSSVPQAYVAQILTSRHLERLGETIDGYELEGLGHHRYLLIAQDPGAWTLEGQPSQHTQEAADSVLQPILLSKADASYFLNNR